MEGLARGWDQLKRQQSELGRRYLQTLRNDPVSLISLCSQVLVADPSLPQTGLTIYTGPNHDAKADKGHDESWFSIMFLYLDQQDIAGPVSSTSSCGSFYCS